MGAKWFGNFITTIHDHDPESRAITGPVYCRQCVLMTTRLPAAQRVLSLLPRRATRVEHEITFPRDAVERVNRVQQEWNIIIIDHVGPE